MGCGRETSTVSICGWCHTTKSWNWSSNNSIGGISSNLRRSKSTKPLFLFLSLTSSFSFFGICCWTCFCGDTDGEVVEGEGESGKWRVLWNAKGFVGWITIHPGSTLVGSDGGGEIIFDGEKGCHNGCKMLDGRLTVTLFRSECSWRKWSTSWLRRCPFVEVRQPYGIIW